MGRCSALKVFASKTQCCHSSVISRTFAVPVDLPMPKHIRPKNTVNKARALLHAGKAVDAVSILKKILARTPENPEALELMAELAFKQGDLVNAARMLQTVIAAQPGNISALNKMAVVCATQSRFPQAARYLRLAISISPGHFPAHLDLCKVTREMGLLDESIAAGRKAVELKADDPRAHSSLALSYECFGQHLQAHTHYLRAAELAPADIQRQFACGISHIGIGEKERARELLEQVTVMDANHAQAHWMLSRLSRCPSPEDSRVKHLESLLSTSDSDDETRVYLHFALGKMYEDCGHYDQAFEHFAAGNRIENARFHYRPADYRRHVEKLMATWSCTFLSSLHDAGSPSRLPLFIVGLPRSGTTLVEQILASHPAVYGAGELSWFAKTEHDLAEFTGSNQTYPDCVTALQKPHIEALAEKYLAYLNTLAEQKDYQHVTDKMPSNFERIGLIKALFPNARIIHCMRDPLDNAISQFCLLFRGSMEYSHDLYNLGTHYADYQRLMSHWKTCLPGQILDIEYEALVADHESEIRRLLTFLELPWDDACLNFFAAKRAVRTSSDFQVRSPIYSSSVGRWKHYEKFLEPLHRGLRDGTTVTPAEQTGD